MKSLFAGCGCLFIVIGLIAAWAFVFMLAINFVFSAALTYWQALVLWIFIARIINAIRAKR